MIDVSKHNTNPSVIHITFKPHQSTEQEIHLQPTKQTTSMERVAPREGVFHNQSLNQLKPQFNYINKPSIICAQLTTKPATRDVSSSYFKPNNDPLSPTEVNHPGKRAENAEISIFDAEKYFNGAHDPRGNNNNSHHKNGGIYTISNLKQSEIPSITRSSLSTPKQSISSISRLSSVSDNSYGRNHRPRPSHVTPTVSSEASWNSQTGLLIHPPGLAPVSIRNLPSAANRTGRKTTASLKWFLRGNKCPCSGKKSVNVEESNSDREANRTPPSPLRIVQLNRISCGSGGGSLYSSRQSSPKTLQHTVRGSTNSTAATTRANLIPDQPIINFIPRPQLDQNKIIPNSDDLPDRVAVTVRTFADGSGTTSNGFTFPILSNSATPPKRMFNVVPPISVSASGGSAAVTPRDSLEVFQPQDDGAGRTFTFPTSPNSRRASYEDEMCSDASSDLFEIESFSTTTQSTMFLRRDSLDDPASTFNVRRLQIASLRKQNNDDDQDEEEPATPSVAPTECYAPSEFSVDWSVTTAEGFDRASLAGFSISASEAGYPALRGVSKSGAGGGIACDGESKKRGNGGLLTSCRREKAVNVGPIPIKCRQAQRGGM